MPFWNRKDKPSGSREVPTHDPFPIERIGSEKFQQRVEKLSAVLIAALKHQEWSTKIDTVKTPSAYLTELTRAVYTILSQENGAVQTHRGDPFAYLQSDEMANPATMKVYLQLRPEYKDATEAIAQSIQTQILQKGLHLAGKFDRYPESTRRERIVYYFDFQDRAQILPLLAKIAKEYVTDPGPLRDISPQVLSGINYAMDPTAAWNTFVSRCIPEDQKYVFSYRRMFAFFSALEVAQHQLNSRENDQNALQLQRYITAIVDAIKIFNTDPQQAYDRFQRQINPRG